MKIVVYAICKNEEKFVLRWVNSMSEADEIVVLDTGSTDNTVNLLKQCNKVKVYQKQIIPWRFDVARNYSLDLVPCDADVCVCTDLDEVFEVGWRKQIEKQWKRETTIASYKYVWSHTQEGKEDICFYYEKMHARFGYSWVHPVHEILQKQKDLVEHKIILQDVCLHHYADQTKSRSGYLPLLELAVKEQPQNDRNMHYLGREYMFYNMPQKSIATLKKHLRLKSATWSDERSASMRYIAEQYEKLNKYSLALKYYKLACLEAPHLREPKLELAEYYYRHNKYIDCLLQISALEKIQNRTLTYISQSRCWSEYPFDLASICYYKIKNYSLAYSYCYKALTLAPNNKRIKDNLIIFEALLKRNNHKE